MKLKSYNILFRLFSFLSDKTNGAPIFVKYKILLGTLLLGVVSTSLQAQKKKILSFVTNVKNGLLVEEDAVQLQNNAD